MGVCSSNSQIVGYRYALGAQSCAVPRAVDAMPRDPRGRRTGFDGLSPQGCCPADGAAVETRHRHVAAMAGHRGPRGRWQGHDQFREHSQACASRAATAWSRKNGDGPTSHCRVWPLMPQSKPSQTVRSPHKGLEFCRWIVTSAEFAQVSDVLLFVRPDSSRRRRGTYFGFDAPDLLVVANSARGRHRGNVECSNGRAGQQQNDYLRRRGRGGTFPAYGLQPCVAAGHLGIIPTSSLGPCASPRTG